MKTKLLQYIQNGDCYSLSGPRNSKRRQEVIHILTGTKIPVSKCGVNAIRKALIEVSQVSGGCIAEQNKQIDAWLHS